MSVREALQVYYAAVKRDDNSSRANEKRTYAEVSAAEDVLINIPVRSLDDIEAKLSFICAQLELENDVVVLQATVNLRSDVRAMLGSSDAGLSAA